MQTVRIIETSVAHPNVRIRQEEAIERIKTAVGESRRVEALGRGSRIESRASVLPPEQIAALGSIEERNQVYEREAPRLAMEAVRGLDRDLGSLSFIATSSCTGYMLPGLAVQIACRVGAGAQTARLPITEAGCAGGVVALARAVDYLRQRPGSQALVVAVELCSLAYHSDAEEGNLTSALLFGDGAGAALLESGGESGSGMEILDYASLLVPCPPDVLGFKLTNAGFYPLLSRSLVGFLPESSSELIDGLLARNGLDRCDVGFWLIHPGGPRVLKAIRDEFSIEPDRMRWGWQVLRNSGNTSSAAILEVITRYLQDPAAPSGWGVALAFGPGVSIEALLLQKC